ncbi:MAG: hypothetical protein IKN63_07050 [Bacilli bacterium]|nr:hypothetical protein [Bacilli bacterium]
MKKIVFFSVLFLGGLLFITGCNKKDKFVEYETDLLNFDFDKYVISSSGKIEDDYAEIKFEMNDEKLKDFKKKIIKKMSILTTSDIENLKGSNLYKKINGYCKFDNIDLIYQSFVSGDTAKTRDVYAVLCNDNNKYYLNIIG